MTFLLGGMTGGFTHCIGMCGPFVACDRMCHGSGCKTSARLSAATGLPYHLGRMLTYGALGFAAGLLSRQVAAYSWWPRVAALMLALAGFLFILSFFRTLTHTRPAPKLTFARGALLGFLPCGLLYAALMMAATLADPLLSMLAMWIFALGTVPALLIASLGADFITRKWQHGLETLGRAMMAFNGLSLLVIAAKTMR